MKRSRKNKSSNKASLQKRLEVRSGVEDAHAMPRFLTQFSEGLFDGFASPFIFLLGSDLSLAKRPISGVAEAWQDVGYYIRESAIQYERQQGPEKRP
jgi:hypothetical protein